MMMKSESQEVQYLIVNSWKYLSRNFYRFVTEQQIYVGWRIR